MYLYLSHINNFLIYGNILYYILSKSLLDTISTINILFLKLTISTIDIFCFYCMFYILRFTSYLIHINSNFS